LVGRLEFGPLSRKIDPDQIIIPMGMPLAGLPIGNLLPQIFEKN
jgi:hypothetical protein